MQALLILPHQLYESLPSYFDDMPVFIVEHEHYFTRMKFHKQKLVLHRATMQMYKDHLEKQKRTVTYIEAKQSSKLFSILKEADVTTLHFFDPTDIPLENALLVEAAGNKINLMTYESPNFLAPLDMLEDLLHEQKTFRMQHFYQFMRKEFSILVDVAGKPVGGKWSFDADNRNPLPSHVEIPPLKKASTNEYVKEAQEYVARHFKSHYGNADTFIYPTTFNGARKWFDEFLDNRFKNFGTYQDAMLEGESYLFHSVLTPILNIGLLNPDYIIETTLSYAGRHRIPINDLEGFIRQIVGWREFVRGVYIITQGAQKDENFLKHEAKLSKKFWAGETGIVPVDDVVRKVHETGYAHHIERLMIIGNFMMLSEIDPNEAYLWFMEMFVDSYEWVMIPNVYGMSQYADGGSMVTKPYMSGSNYIRKMSDYKKGPWCEIWDALYWHFLHTNKRTLSKNPRLGVSYMQLDKMKAATLKAHLEIAQKYLKK